MRLELANERRLSRRDPDLRDLRVLVVGLGKSGLAAARLALAHGAIVTVTDKRPAARLDGRDVGARGAGAAVVVGSNPPELADAAELIVVSPGVPPQIDLLRRARELAIPVWGEIELASRFCRGRVIAVTGSNGKSTVTTMIGDILRRAGVVGGVGGNLDVPFAELLSADSPRVVHALELSSFQLETLQSLAPQVALVLNLCPDHLDRYDSYEDYAAAKARLLQLQGPRDHAILNGDDPESERFRDAVRGRLHLFSTRREVERGAFVQSGRLVLRTHHGDEELLGQYELPLRGEHNVANALAAALAARLAGCAPGEIVEALTAFRSLPHRLERVATVNDVTFYNDSKATNPASAELALVSFEAGRVHMILGGRDKGADWTGLVAAIHARAERVLLVGEASGALRPRFEDAVETVDCGTVAEAVRIGSEGASAGDVVLLSPGCASFDQYRNFEERGEDFRRAVAALEGERGDDA